MYGKDGSINADSYVQNGLVFQLDGIDWGNVAGHWIERKNGYDWYEHNNTNLHTEDDCMVLTGNNYYITNDALPSFPISTHSIEMCVMFKNNGWVGITNFGSGNVSFWGNSNSILMWARGSSISGIPQSSLYNLPVSTNTRKVSVHAQSGIFWVDNIGITPTGTGTRGDAGRAVIGTLGYTESSYGFKGSIYAIRIYNRQLSEEEIAHNYEIDKIRFNIE